MPPSPDRKLYLGPRLRLLRRELGLNQTQMAEELGVSPSYLNHLERNQRPFTAQMLLRLADTYDVDMRGFVAAANEASSSDLHEIFADALVRDIGVPRQEVIEVAENYPGIAEAVTRLYRALSDLRQVPDRVESAGAGGTRIASPLAWLRDWLDGRRNHFADLDAAAEALSDTLTGASGDDPDALHAAMVRRLHEQHGVGVRIVGRDVLPGAVRHYDYHRRRLMLADTVSSSARRFEIAARLAVEDLSGVLLDTAASAAAPDAETRALAQQALANYAAAAIIMPYGRFHAAAESSRYDLDLLTARFGMSYEQVAHRLTTLDRQGARGVPLFLLKLDVAGNVAKRFAGDTMPLARFGGGCPRWHIHRAFRHLGETVTDLVEMPKGATYLTWSRALARGEGREPVAIVLGCEAKQAARVRYGDTAGAATPIGPACHVCERTDCTDRSLPPIARSLDVSPARKARAPYPFRAI